MLIYLICFAANMLLGLLLVVIRPNHLSEQHYQTRKKWYLFLTAVEFGLLCGFRADSVGYDTKNYHEIFKLMPNSISIALHEDTVNGVQMERGYILLCSLIKSLGGSFQTLLIIYGLFIMSSCCIFIYRHSKNVLLSVFIVVSFPFYYSSFDIIRHFMATAFFLLGYKYIVERKFWKYFLFIFIGSLFHSFAWIFLIFYFIGKVKWNFATFLTVMTGTVLCGFFIEPIAIRLSGWLGKSDGIDTGWIGSYGGVVKTAIMYMVIFIIALILYYNLKERTREDMLAVNYVLILLAFSIIFINARMMTRLIMTSVPLLAIAMPQLFDAKRMADRKIYDILYMLFITIGVGYHLFMLLSNWQNVVPYNPYWKG